MRILKFIMCAIMIFGGYTITDMHVQAAEAPYHITIEGTNNQTEARKIIDMVNKERNKIGARSLDWNTDLEKAAMQRAAEITVNFSHTRPNGERCFSVSSSAYGENIAYGYVSSEDVFDGWMNSSGHKRNMMDNDFSSIGIASFKVDGVKYWVQLFGISTSGNQINDTSANNSATTVNIDVLPTLFGGISVDMGDTFWLTDGKSQKFSLYLKNPEINSRGTKISNSSVTWSSSNNAIVVIDDKGVAYGQKDGEAVITGNIKKHPNLKASINVKTTNNPLGPHNVSIRYSEKTITKGQSFQFNAKFQPSGTTSTVSWRTGNSAIASVDSSGKVTANKAGNTYLYAKTKNGKEAKCLIKVVNVPATDVKINYGEKTLSVNDTFKFSATVKPSASDQKVTWRTGNSSVATVDQTGKVTAKSAGNTYLYARTANGKEYKCLLKIKPVATSVKINYSEKTLTVGDIFKFASKITPDTAIQTVTWRTGNSAVATVDQTGKVTAKGIGNTYLYARTANGKEFKCLIRVKK